MDYCDVFISCLNSHFDGTHSLHRNLFWWRSNSSTSGGVHFYFGVVLDPTDILQNIFFYVLQKQKSIFFIIWNMINRPRCSNIWTCESLPSGIHCQNIFWYNIEVTNKSCISYFHKSLGQRKEEMFRMWYTFSKNKNKTENHKWRS